MAGDILESTEASWCYSWQLNCANFDGLLIVQGSLYAITLYDAVYLYLKLASEVLSEGGKKADITNGTNMYHRAKNYHLRSSECSFVIYVLYGINHQTFGVNLLSLPPIYQSIGGRTTSDHFYSLNIMLMHIFLIIALMLQGTIRYGGAVGKLP